MEPEVLAALEAAVTSLADEIADMIADWHGRSVDDTDHDLALAILARLIKAEAVTDALRESLAAYQASTSEAK